jgi:hypothetical protein
VATETTETKTDERGPLLDLQEITAKRDYIIGPDGETYFLHTEGLSAIDHHRLTHCVERHDELFAKKPEDMTAAEAKELSAVTDEMLGLVLEAPAKVRKQIPGQKAREIVRHFQGGSQPDAVNLPGLLALLMGMAQTQAATDAIEGQETTETSTTAS